MFKFINCSFPWKCLLLFISAVAFAIACNKPENPTPTPDPTPTESIVFDSGVDTKPVVKAEGGDIRISFKATEDWTASLINTKADGWISLDKTSGYAGSATITITVAANDTPDERNATVQIKAGTTTKFVVVSQKGKGAIIITASKTEFGPEVGVLKIEVESNIDFTYAVASGCEDWIKEVSTKSMTTTTLYFIILPNQELTMREGSVVIKSSLGEETVRIYQSGAAPVLVLSKKDFSIKAEGEDILIEVSSNMNITMSIPSDCDWITENVKNAVSTSSYHLSVAANTTIDTRTAKVIFSNVETKLSETVTITQTGRDVIHVESVSLDKAQLSMYPGDKETLSVTIGPENADFKNVTWSSSDESVATVTEGRIIASGDGSATISAKSVDGEITATCSVSVLPADYSDCFCITAAEPGTTVTLQKAGTINTTYKYSTDKLTWDVITLDSPLPVLAGVGDKMYIRAASPRNENQSSSNYIHFSSDKNFKTSGNVMFLTDPAAMSDAISRPYEFYALFAGCTTLTDAEELSLPAKTLAANCYDSMFSGCTGITKAPKLPALNLVECCYYHMFQGCSALEYVKCLATDVSAGNCTTDWLDAVSATGTFVKTEGMTSWSIGASGIPSGWTVKINDTETGNVNLPSIGEGSSF